MLRLAVVFSTFLLVAAVPAWADEIEEPDFPVPQPEQPAPRAPAPRPAPAPQDAMLHHHLSGYFASAHDENFDDTEFNGGAEYEYQFHRYFGVGAAVEGTTGDIRDMAALGNLYLHPWRGLRFTLGGGVNVGSKDDDYAGGAQGLLRVGAGYHFRLGDHMFAGPEYNADLVEGKDPVHLFGARLGVSF